MPLEKINATKNNTGSYIEGGVAVGVSLVWYFAFFGTPCQKIIILPRFGQIEFKEVEDYNPDEMSPKGGSNREKSILELCEEKGIKVTRKRGLVAEILESSQGHQSAYTIFKLAKERDPTIGQATVYRALKLFSREGVVDARMFGQDHSRFESSLKEHHDHLICSQCGKIEEFVDVELEKLKGRVAKFYHFTMESHTLEIYGVCSECAKPDTKA